MSVDPTASARFLGAFFDELERWGVHDVVVSPGSRSTPLTMVAYELARRSPERMRLYVDVDERGAAFFALGLAKASGSPAAVICTSGTAIANYYPAVLEAESSRVPLIVLTGDRPPRLQGLGAPQTCDQLNAYGAHVRAFRQMPLPSGDDAALAFARQAAREARIAAGGDAAPALAGLRISGACEGGPVHLNFPFDEPLKPNLGADGLFDGGRRGDGMLPDAPIINPTAYLDQVEAGRLLASLKGRRVLVLAGEGSCATVSEAHVLLAWADTLGYPLLADPLSGLRALDDLLIIDTYDTVLGAPADALRDLVPEVVIRFGRYPVSKRATMFAASAAAYNIVADPFETRDFNHATDLFVSCRSIDLAQSMLMAAACLEPDDIIGEGQRAFAGAWTRASEAARTRIAGVASEAAAAVATGIDAAVTTDVAIAAAAAAEPANTAATETDTAASSSADGFEGAFVHRMLELAPEGSCLFAANSMSIRALDTFYVRGGKPLTMLCNRGLNGIDGTVSTALGAAQRFAQTTLLTGDLTLLHDLNALALQRELRVQREAGGPAPSIAIVLLNNNGGGIFDMLPQRSADPYFERLFLTPQDVDFGAAAQAFGVPYAEASTVEEFAAAYRAALGVPGISLVEVRVPLEGLPERYAPYW